MSASIDFYIEEAQMLLARSLQTELEMSALVEHGWFSDASKSYYVNWKGAKGHVKYEPGRLWDPEQNDVRVTHQMAGVDVDSLIIGAGQRVGMDTLSRDTFMQIDPLVEDPAGERDKIVVERLEAATLANLEQMAAAPESPFGPLDWASLASKIRSGADLWEAIEEVQTEAQERAAELAAQEPDPMSPEAMPGPMDQGLEPSVRPPGDSIPGLPELGQLALATRGPQMRLGNEA